MITYIVYAVISLLVARNGTRMKFDEKLIDEFEQNIDFVNEAYGSLLWDYESFIKQLRHHDEKKALKAAKELNRSISYMKESIDYIVELVIKFDD